MLGISPTAIGFMTPAGLEAAFREHRKELEQAWEDEQKASDRRASTMLTVLGRLNGAGSGFDADTLFPRLQEPWDDDRVVSAWKQVVAHHNARVARA